MIQSLDLNNPWESIPVAVNERTLTTIEIYYFEIHEIFSSDKFEINLSEWLTC